MISTDRETLRRTPISELTKLMSATPGAETPLQRAEASVPDPMLDLVTRHRAWRAAHACAVFGDPDDEDAWFDANPNPAGDTLLLEPPLPTTTTGALAAVRFVMEDADYVQKPHAAILRQALAFLEGGATAGLTASSPDATLLGLIEEYRAAHQHVWSLHDVPDDVMDEAVGKTQALSDRMAATSATTLEGLRAKAEALRLNRIVEGTVTLTEGRTTDMILAASILTDLGAPTIAGNARGDA